MSLLLRLLTCLAAAVGLSSCASQEAIAGAAHLRGQGVQRRIDTGSAVATPENMRQPAIRKLLAPDFKQWLKEQ
jgi:hypothetical protein